MTDRADLHALRSAAVPLTDRQIIRVARSFRRGLLGKRPSDSMCFAVCAPLAGLLDLYGVEATLEEVQFPLANHFWLRLSDGRILDPTADQFSGPLLKLPPIYLGPVPEVYERWIAEGDA